jgi:hypothetical protein
MSDKDCAIVVGVWLYPGLTDLSGPESDAAAFANWVRRPGPGDVPPDRVKLILTSDFAPPPFPGVDQAKPTRDKVEEAFDWIDQLARDNENKGNGLRAGERLYIYFAGHGFAPVLDESALLMANATRNRVRYHVAGKAWANWFYKAGYFDEVVLFMDCCRENYPGSPINAVGFGDITGNLGKRFFGFGTKWRKTSWERPMPDGKVHGVFTTALLTGLTGAGADPTTGLVTANSLRNYLINCMKNFLSDDDLKNPDIEKEPDVNDPDNAGDGMILAKVAVPNYTVKIQLPAAAAGKTVRVLTSNNFQQVASTTANGSDWTIKLKPGTYLVQVAGNGQEKVIDVRGSEPDPPGISVVL